MDALVPAWLLDIARRDGIAAVVIALISAALAVYRMRRDARRAAHARPAPAPPAPGGRQRLLIVEDDPAATAVLRRVIEMEFPRIDVLTAGLVSEAAAILASSPPPDVALVDCYLPDGNGWDLARSAPRTTRVILMSGTVEPYLLPQLADGAAALAMRKPIDIDDLIRVVRMQLAAPSRASVPAIREG